MAGRSKLLMYGSAVAAVVAVAGAGYSIARNAPVPPERTPVYPPAGRPSSVGPGNLLGAVGLVEPASEPIAVGSTAAGVVTAVAVRPGDVVTKGDVLFVVDERPASADVAAAREDLRAAEARLRETEAQVGPAEARVASCEAALRLAKVELAERQEQFRRAEALGKSGVVSREDYDQRRYGLDGAAARVADAEAKLREERANLALLKSDGAAAPTGGAAGPTVDVQRAAVSKARAALAQAEVRLALHTVRAPLTATVLQVRVRVGEYVPTAALADPLMVLGVTDPLHVRADIDEAEIGRFRPGARAVASLRGQPDRRAALTFVRAEPLVVPKRVLTGTAAERVDTRVMQVIFALAPGDLPARPGQQVDVYVEAPAGGAGTGP